MEIARERYKLELVLYQHVQAIFIIQFSIVGSKSFVCEIQFAVKQTEIIILRILSAYCQIFIRNKNDEYYTRKYLIFILI